MARGGCTTGSFKKGKYIKIIQEKGGIDGRRCKKLERYSIKELKDLINLIETVRINVLDEVKKAEKTLQ